MQIDEMCQKHKQHLVLFCGNQQCQERICPACVLVQHQGHKIIGLVTKAGEIKDKMEVRKNGARDISLLLGKYLVELNEVEEKVKKETSGSLDQIDNAREQLRQRIKELHQKVQEETEAHKLETLFIQKENLAAIQEKKETIQHCKAQLDSFYVEVEKSMNSLSENALVQNDGNVEKVFNDLSEKELTEIDFKKFEHPDLSAQLILTNSGTLNKPNVTVKPSTELKAQIHKALHRIIEITLQSVNTILFPFYDICVSKDGSAVMSGKKYIDNEYFFKCMKNYQTVWEMNTGNNQVTGLCCITKNNEYLVNSILKRLEARDMTNGRVIHKWI